MIKRTFFIVYILSIFLLDATAQVIYINNYGTQSKYDSTVFSSNQPPAVKLKPISVQNIQLLYSLFNHRYDLNKKYLMSLENDKLLQNFYNEAGRNSHSMLNSGLNYKDFHWGWESPSNQLRGHFLGHWLSAAAYLYAETHDEEVKAKADKIVSELAQCQIANGGQWAGSIPEKYLDLMAKGQFIWSPQYTIHKTFMGLWDWYTLTGSTQALDILDKFSDWFHAWTGKQIANNNEKAIYMGETCGMLEIWANLYGLTKNQKYLDLMKRYGNPNLFQSLLKGEDALSNEHANASIPWSHGSARLYEVTGNAYWKKITMAFWKNAVIDRESFCTGGQNAGEYWIPPHQLDKFTSKNNQEHCTVYNMIRTADYLYRWTGDLSYADYIEQNIYNGILAQQNPNTGMVAYFLPMAPGCTKGGEGGWGTPTMDFWCCHGSLVQAQVRYLEYIYYENQEGLIVSQYIPSELNWKKGDANINVQQQFLSQNYDKEPLGSRWRMKLTVTSDKPAKFALQLRLPGWLTGKAIIKVNGVSETVNVLNGYYSINREWKNDEVYVEFPTKVSAVALPGAKSKYAFMEGPIVLAGITDNEHTIKGDINKTETVMAREYEHEYKIFPWKHSHYWTVNQPVNFRFVPLYEVVDEKYTIYFPVQK